MPNPRRSIADEDIMARLANNPRDAMPLIVDKYGDALQGILMRMVTDRLLAEDLLQDALVKVWKNAASYNAQRGRLFTWLLGIARNTAIDYLRVQKNQRQRQSISLDHPVYEAKVQANLADEPQNVDPGLQQVIGQLDEKHRQLIDLLYLQGYTQQEATDLLGIPLGTVKTRSQAAIRELRKLLGNQEWCWWALLGQWFIYLPYWV